jgi:hypothetical protein
MFNPMQAWANSVQLAMMLGEAQMVIAMRMAGMAGVWPVTKYENSRMVSEKAYAVTKAASAVARASLRGAQPEAVVAAAIKPVRQKTRSNARRLTKRGLKKR